MTIGACALTRTSRMQRRGVDRTCTTSSPRTRARDSMGPNIVTGIKQGSGIGDQGSGEADGFTMIELLIVMTLIVLLASIGMVQYRNSVTRAEEAALKENLFRMRDAMDQFYADKNKWPADLAELVSEGYI